MKAKVCPPRLGGARVGVFSTRSPHRPNNIGLSLARLDSVQGDTVRRFNIIYNIYCIIYCSTYCIIYCRCTWRGWTW